MSAPEPQPLDLRADLHGHALDFAADLDRAYFAANPDAESYTRQPVEHEWCGLAEGVVAVLVVRLGADVRARRPLFAGEMP
jgi:hypothetical protein